MSILINESYANETVPLWSVAGGGGGDGWSTFPAITNVDMAGYTINNGNFSSAGNVTVSGVSSTYNSTDYLASYTGNKIQMIAPLYFLPNDVLSNNNGTGNGVIMNNNSYNFTDGSPDYIPDIISAAPQLNPSIVLTGLSTTIPYNTSTQIDIGQFDMIMIQSDASQQFWKLNLSISFNTDTSVPLGLTFNVLLDLIEQNLATQIFGSSPFFINPTYSAVNDTYLYSASITDYLNLQNHIFNDYGSAESYIELIINAIQITDDGADPVSIFNISYTYTLEPCYVNSGL